MTVEPAELAAAELAVGALVFLCSFLGVASSVLWWLAAGYALHGALDWVHDMEVVPTRVARWFPPACAIFDLALAGFVLAFLGGLAMKLFSFPIIQGFIQLFFRDAGVLQ